MITYHLTDNDIQIFISDKANCELTILEHINNCEHCKTKVNVYESIFATIEQQPTPIFDFNLGSLVLSQIPQPKTKFVWSNLINQVLVFIGILTIVVLFFLIGKYLLPTIGATSNEVIYLIIVTAILVLLFQGFDLLKKHQLKMTAIN